MENWFLNFYKNLWSSSSPHNLDSTFMLYLMICLFLLIWMESFYQDLPPWGFFKTLHSMPRGKSPGPDGINVEFYLFYWNQIGDHLLNAISYFFSTGLLPNSWGKTYVMLIPKKPNPVTVSDLAEWFYSWAWRL